MSKTAGKTLFGFRLTDLLGIIIMIIPFYISMMSFDSTKRVIPFIPWLTKTVQKDINPDLITAFLSVAFYGALIIRYGIFRRDNFAQAAISSIRFFLNCWVIAALISVVIDNGGKENSSFGIFQFNTCTLLLAAVIFTWIGMKTIAGYSWIIFILAGIGRVNEIDKAMGKTGAVFIITFAISLFLQIENYAHIREFASDFRVSTGKYSNTVKSNINLAAGDAAHRVSTAAKEIKKTINL